MKLWILSKRLNSFRLVVLLKESGREFQYLAAAYLTELKPYVTFHAKTYYNDFPLNG